MKTMNGSQYEMILYWDKTDKIFIVDVPELQGCTAHGNTKKEAIENAENAVQFWMETAREDGLKIPEPKGRLIFA